MSDIFTKVKRSDVMSRIRGTGNKGTELRLIQIFRAARITGWRRGCVIRGRKAEDRRQKKRFSVRPDFVFPKLKTAVFVDGCFWHGCPRHATWPKTNAAFWRKKIARNRQRDLEVGRALRRTGWSVIRVWEHALRRKEGAGTVRRLMRRLSTPL